MTKKAISKRVVRIPVTMTTEEADRIRERADAAGRSVSNYLLRLGLGLEAPVGATLK